MFNTVHFRLVVQEVSA